LSKLNDIKVFYALKIHKKKKKNIDKFM